MAKTQKINHLDYEHETVLQRGHTYLIHAAEDIGIEIWQEHEELTIYVEPVPRARKKSGD